MSLAEFNFLGWRFATAAFDLVWRSALVAALCGLLDLLLRRRPAEIRDMLWRAMLLALLAFPVLSIVLPPLLPAPALETVNLESPGQSGTTYSRDRKIEFSVTPLRSERIFPWATLPFALYSGVAMFLLLRLASGMGRVRAVVARSRFCEDEQLRGLIHEAWLASEARIRPRVRLSSEVRVPVALEHDTEMLILLPENVAGWDEAKLRLVLEHEMCHVRRNDPAMARFAWLVACFFWFHPLAWFVKRRLASLAEDCCDEFVLQRSRSPQRYAGVLLEFAREISVHRTRVLQPASAMLHSSRLERRIGRIFEASERPHHRGALMRVIAVAVLFPALYLAAAARSGRPQSSPAADAKAPRWSFPTNAEQAAQLEEQLVAKPDDFELHRQLLMYYMEYIQGPKYVRELLWMIEHHPEDPTASSFLRPDGGPLNTADGYARVKQAWEQALSEHSNSPPVLLNAGRFFERTDSQRAFDLLQQARRAAGEDAKGIYRQAIASLYTQAFIDILNARITQVPFTTEFAAQLRSELEGSSDAELMSAVGTQLARIGTRISPELKAKGFDLLQRAIDLDPANPSLKEALESAKAEPIRQQNYDAVMRRSASPGTVRIGAKVAEANLETKVDPVYPPLALSARLQGTVEFSITIATDGHIQNMQLVRGHPLLVNAAKEALLQYKYKPTMLNGKPVPVVTDVEVLFQLPQ